MEELRSRFDESGVASDVDGGEKGMDVVFSGCKELVEYCYLIEF